MALLKRIIEFAAHIVQTRVQYGVINSYDIYIYHVIHIGHVTTSAASSNAGDPSLLFSNMILLYVTAVLLLLAKGVQLHATTHTLST